MKRERSILTSLIPLASVLLVLIIGFSCLQYRWFSSIAQTEYDRETHELELRVMRTTGRESLKFGILKDYIRLLESGLKRREDLLSQLATLYELFGPEGRVVELISAIRIDYPAESLVLDGDSWTPAESRSISGSSFVLAVPVDKEEIEVHLFIDEQGFYRQQILPALQEALPEQQLTWFTSSESADPLDNGTSSEDGPELDNPLSGLFSGLSEQVRTIALPGLSQLLSTDVPPKPIIPDRQREELESFVVADSSAPGYLLGIRSLTDPYSASVTRNLAFVWGSSTLLMSLIGLFALFVLYQLRVKERLRMKEKAFTSAITHELRTPLTVIGSAADNLRQMELSPERIISYGMLIDQQRKRLSTMVDNILEYARIESAARREKAQPTDLIHMIDEIKDAVLPAAELKHCRLQWDTAAASSIVTIDKEQVKLAAINGIMNALMHAYGTQGGDVRIRMRCTASKNLEIIIEDDGRGIPRRELKKVLDPFVRGEEAVTDQHPGSGLGLFIIEGCMRRLGGDLRLYSPYEGADGSMRQGCRVSLRIPFRSEQS